MAGKYAGMLGEHRETGVKRCSGCETEKPLAEFYSRANRRPNRIVERLYNHRCKACDKEWQRKNRIANTHRVLVILPPEKRCSSCKLTKPSDAFALRGGMRSGLQGTCKECLRDRRYELEPGQYDRMLEEQGGVCDICREPCPRGGSLSVDHCHSTGRVRGLLCQNCNAALGMLRDSPELLTRAIAYLAKGGDR